MKYKLITTAFLLSPIFYLLSPIQAQAAMVVGSGGVSNGLTQGLVGWWTFDGRDMSPTLAYDKSGNGYTGTISGLSKNSGKVGQAISLTGSGCVSVPQNSDFNSISQQTISVWALSSNITGNRNIIFKSDNSSVFYSMWQFGSKWTYSIQPAAVQYNVQSGTTITPNTWTHIVGTYDGSYIRLYVNGVLSNTPVAVTGTVDTGSFNPLSIGSHHNCSTSPWLGKIDDVHIYNRALSANEIYSLYKYGSSKIVQNETPKDKLTQGLVGWWTMDANDIAGNVLLDRSGTGNKAVTTQNRFNLGPGKIGQGLNMPGVAGQEGVIPASASLTPTANGTMTISVWEKKRTGGSYFGKQDDPGLNPSYIQYSTGKDSTGRYIFYYHSGVTSPTYHEYQSYYTNAITPDDNWHHIVFIFTNGVTGLNIKVYRDGVLIPGSWLSGSGGIALGTGATGQASIGKYIPNYGAGYHIGGLDDIRVYNRGLSANEVYSLYKYGSSKVLQNESPLNKLTNNLAGYWTFDGPDCGATYCVDKSGSGNTSTLTGTKKTIGKIGQALNFNGTSDVVSATVSSPSAVTYWYKTDAGNWTFNASSTSGSMTTTYVNGQAAALATNPVYIAGTSVSMGKTDASTYFSGKIDDVRIYNNPLSANEVYSLYKYGK